MILRAVIWVQPWVWISVPQESYPNGHYNHLDAINRINTYGSIPAFIEGENIKDGIIRACVENNVPFVLNGSIRDDGPLPEVYEHTYDGQDTIRSHVRKATTVIGMAHGTSHHCHGEYDADLQSAF